MNVANFLALFKTNSRVSLNVDLWSSGVEHPPPVNTCISIDMAMEIVQHAIVRQDETTSILGDVDGVHRHASLEQDNIRGWKGFKHVTCDETQVAMVTGGFAEDVSEVQHGALDARERLGDHPRARAVAAANVHERALAAKDAPLIQKDDLEEELAVRGYGVVCWV